MIDRPCVAAIVVEPEINLSDLVIEVVEHKGFADLVWNRAHQQARFNRFDEDGRVDDAGAAIHREQPNATFELLYLPVLGSRSQFNLLAGNPFSRPVKCSASFPRTLY